MAELADDGEIDSESDNSDGAADEDKESAALRIDTSAEELQHPHLRAAFVKKEQEYWHQTNIVERCAVRSARAECPLIKHAIASDAPPDFTRRCYILRRPFVLLSL